MPRGTFSPSFQRFCANKEASSPTTEARVFAVCFEQEAEKQFWPTGREGLAAGRHRMPLQGHRRRLGTKADGVLACGGADRALKRPTLTMRFVLGAD